MSRGRLRAAALGLGVALLIAAAVADISCSSIAALRLAFPAVVMLGAVAFERWRYKRLSHECPGRGWVATEERFIDPETGQSVAVYYDPANGERRYIASP
jgi:hypothetical protein